MNAPQRDRSKRIFLTGFMASGKSTVGPLLSKELGYRFVDLDREIEKAARSSIASIFSEHGEGRFRMLERKHIQGLTRRSAIVVALGGGSLVDAASRETVRTSGILIYLEVPLGVIVARLRRSEGRPMIAAARGATPSARTLRARVRSLLRSRETVYRTADITIKAGVRPPAEIVQEILRALAMPHAE